LKNIQAENCFASFELGRKAEFDAVPIRGGPIGNPMGVSAKLVAWMDDVRFVSIGSNDRL
jgi:hypothetical protein